MRRVVITGIGILSPLGEGIEAAADALRNGRSGIRAMPEWRNISGLRTWVAGTVDQLPSQLIPRAQRRTMGKLSLMAALASREAVADAVMAEPALDSERVGVAFGSTTGSPAVLEQFMGDYIAKRSVLEMEGTVFMKVMSHTAAANVAALLGAKGVLLAPCTACASSTQAIGMGYELIRRGDQDVMICGGAEELHATTAGVFDVLHAASRNFNDTPTRTPRPFDRDRDGLVVSEGAAALVLEDYESAKARGARMYGEVAGYATTCDARHMTQPSKEGMRRCMQLALQSAQIGAGDLSYINAHATGTVMGDAAEAEATREVVGDRVPVSGTKGHTGHTLGACGAMEAAFCLVMMRDGFIAPTLNLDCVSTDCEGIRHVRYLQKATVDIAMSNSFAFGGVNASLILRKV